MINLVSDYLISHITHIVYTSLSSCFDAWKLVNTIPLAKIFNLLELNNLRSINLLPVLSNVLEIAMYNQIYDYVFSNNAIPFFNLVIAKVTVLLLRV